MKTLWDSHPHAHSHTLSRVHPSRHSDKATWGHGGTLGSCIPGPLAATHHPATPRCAPTSQSTLRREVWRGLRSDTLDSPPLGLTDAADKNKPGTEARGQSREAARTQEVAILTRSLGRTSPWARPAPVKEVTLDTRQGKGPGSRARPRSGHVHISQEQPQLSQAQAVCITDRSLRNWGKGLVGRIPKPYQLRHEAHTTNSAGRCLGPEGTHFRYASRRGGQRSFPFPHFPVGGTEA